MPPKANPYTSFVTYQMYIIYDYLYRKYNYKAI